MSRQDMALGRGTAIERPKGSATSAAENDQTTFLSSEFDLRPLPVCQLTFGRLDSSDRGDPRFSSGL